jgi:hypothetical protein
VVRALDGTADGLSPLEKELAALAQRSCHGARGLSPSSLAPLRAITGDGALEYAEVMGQFHFMTRIADLLGVQLEIPSTLRRFEWLRRLGLWTMSLLQRRLDLAPRSLEKSADQALEDLAPLFEKATGERLGEQLDALRPRPALLESLQQGLEELLQRTSLSREVLTRVSATVETALPSSEEDVSGIHTRPKDPVGAFAFVGTRYAYRVTGTMIDALRGVGFDDVGILDLAIAVALLNRWERQYRLLGIPLLASLSHLDGATPAVPIVGHRPS